jgi:hypothetical protein
MQNVTAVILSRAPLRREVQARVPDPLRTFNFVSDIRSFRSYQRSWFMAIEEVSTEWFFFLDADDSLPSGFLDILGRMIKAAGPAALVYSNELIINDAGVRVEWKKRPYSQEAHLKDPILCHHLVVGRTEVAKRAIQGLPRGEFMPETLVYFQMAKEGAVWVDEIAYHWHRGATGMHRWPGALAAQMNSRRWCQESLSRPVHQEAPAPQQEPESRSAAKRPMRKTK